MPISLRLVTIIAADLLREAVDGLVGEDPSGWMARASWPTRAELGDHPALNEAVLVASELATNAITHSASGHDGGMFMIHLTAISSDHVAILVTDQGGHGEPAAQHAGRSARRTPLGPRAGAAAR